MEMRIVLFILMCINTSGDAAVTLTSNGRHCLGQTSRITCTHPFNNGSLVILWERNGTRLTSFAGIHSLTDVEPTYTTLNIHLTKDDFADKVWIYRCYTQNLDTSVRDYSSEVMINVVEVPSPKVSEIQPKSNVLVYEVEHHPNMECYSNHTFQYHVISYPVISGVPDETQLQNGFSFNDTVMIDGLMSDMSYKVNITAECVGNEDVVSDPLSMNSMTVEKPITFNSTGPVCFDRQVQLTCQHHDITDTTSVGPIFSQTSPVVWMKDREGIDLPDTYHMVVSQSNTETVVSVTTRKSIFLNGEANYSCAVVYADGSMEESEPVTVIMQESPLPPTSPTSNYSDTSISLQWSHRNDCFENCNFIYEVTWKELEDSSSIRATINMTSYTIERLSPDTSYNIEIRAYCKEDLNVRSDSLHVFITTSELDSYESQNITLLWITAFGAATSVLIIILVVTCVLAVYRKTKKETSSKLYGHDIDPKEEERYSGTPSPSPSGVSGTAASVPSPSPVGEELNIEANPSYIPLELARSLRDTQQGSLTTRQVNAGVASVPSQSPVGEELNIETNPSYISLELARSVRNTHQGSFPARKVETEYQNVNL